jgi:hypothetical protein
LYEIDKKPKIKKNKKKHLKIDGKGYDAYFNNAFLFNINLHDKSDSGYPFGIFKLFLNLCRCQYMYQN